MSELDDLFDRARQLSGEELERLLTELTDQQRTELLERLSATIEPTAADVDPHATTDRDSGAPNPPFSPPKATRVSRGGNPKAIGPYRIMQPLGEGGMGQVYLAEQSEPVKRRVALKVINTETPTDKVLARFEAERQALAMMDHQNIAKVLDAGRAEDGRPYFAMELVKGLPLTEYCDKNWLTPNERLELFVQACRAIQHAHQKGVIHRDLKPSNVLVGLYDGKPIVKVIDFGLAKAVHEQLQLTDKTLFTQHGQVVGTLQYMSPEQAELSSLDIDTRTDVYSLGVILYELLTGSTPLGHERLRAQAFDRILTLIREEEAPRPSQRLSSSGDAISGISEQRKTDPRRLGLILRGDLDWIAIKALEKDRSQRYDGPAALADDVERYLNSELVSARPPSPGYRLKKAYRKHRIAFLTSFAFVALLLVGVTSTAIMWLRAKQLAESNAVLASDNERKAREAQRALDEMIIAQRERMRTAVASLNSSGGIIQPPLSSLEVFPLDDLLEQLQQHFQAATDNKLALAYALAYLGDVRVDFLLSEAERAPAIEAANVVRSLERSPQAALETISVKASSFDEFDEVSLRSKTRLAMLSLQLGDAALATNMCRPRPDPLERTVFIDECSSWFGDLRRLREVLPTSDNSSLQSAVCLSLGSVSPGVVNTEQRADWSALLTQWYSNMSDPGLHSAAGWALRQWGIPVPELPTGEPQRSEEQQQNISMANAEVRELHRQSLDRRKTWEYRLSDLPLEGLNNEQTGLVFRESFDVEQEEENARDPAGRPSEGKYIGPTKPKLVPGVVGSALELDIQSSIDAGPDFRQMSNDAFTLQCWYQLSPEMPKGLLFGNPLTSARSARSCT